MKQRAYGFTIVELLVVIVVVAILAGLSMVVYGGVQKRAGFVAVESDVVNLAKQLSLFELENNNYPAAINSCPSPAAGAICASLSGGNTANYVVRNSSFSLHNMMVVKPGYELTVMRDNSFVYTSTLEVTNNREFVQYADLAPVMNMYGMVDYSLTFDIKSASTINASRVNVYFQNGSDSRYYISAIGVPVTTEFVRHRVTFKPDPVNYYPAVTASWLAFYGTYDTGNIPTVRNVRFELAK